MELFAKTIGSHASRVAIKRASANQSATISRSIASHQAAISRIELDYEELSDLLTFNSNLALIDVRNSSELDTYGSIPGAINIPLNEVKAALQLDENEFRQMFLLPKPSKNAKDFVFFARGPNASSAAVEIAHRLGYKGSRQYSGGWEDYCNRSGVPLKKNSPNATAEQSTPFMNQRYYNSYKSYSM